MDSRICDLKTYSIIITILVMLASPFFLNANLNKDLISNTCHSNESLNQYETKNKRDQKKLGIMAEGQYLRSTTHTTKFKGAEVIGSYLLIPSFSVGMVSENSYTAYHSDNNYNLTHVKFYPVFLDSKLDLTRNSLLTPFLHLSTGSSIANYINENIADPGKFYHVSEIRLNLYSGIGASYKVNEELSTFNNLGFKGVRMSFHELDRNPNGLIIRLGLNL